MQTETFTVGSVTNATKARRLLEGAGIRAQTVKLEESALHGCVYGIRFPKIDYYAVVRLLKENGIAYTAWDGGDR